MEKLLNDIVELKNLVAKRARQFIIADGCDINLYETPDSIDFEKDSVNVIFNEKTRHDCPESRSTTLTLADLKMSEGDWNNFIENRTKETADRILQSDRTKAENLFKQQEKEFEKLRKILGR